MIQPSKKYFMGHLLKKISKLTILHLVLQKEFTGQVETFFLIPSLNSYQPYRHRKIVLNVGFWNCL